MIYTCYHSWKLVGKDIYQCDICKISSKEEVNESNYNCNCNHSWKIVGTDLYKGYTRTYSENRQIFKESSNEIFQCDFCKATL